MTINDIMNSINSQEHNSAWELGIVEYALELLEGLKKNIESGRFNPEDITNRTITHKALLNGASSWHEYSWNGCSLIYNEDIAKRLCTPSELKKTRNGERRPNGREEWLDVQTRAIYQAANRIFCAAKAINREEARA